MYYYNSITDSNGFIHSIDMIYVEYMSYVSIEKIIETIRLIHDKYSNIKYDEYLDKKPCSKYDFYLNNIVFGGVYISIGKFTDYDSESKLFRLLPMFQIRVNPNKYMLEPWFIDLLDALKYFIADGIIRKYDYAIDLPYNINNIMLFNSKKEKGLYKGTRYYGQQGRHGFLKIYDKRKEWSKNKLDLKGMPENITRVEHTLMYNKPLSLEDVFYFTTDSLDYHNLKDTDFAIVDMFLKLKAIGYDYELKLGRGKYEKLMPYLMGCYKKLDYGNYISELLEHMKMKFYITDVDSNGFMNPDDEQTQAIMDMFG